MGTHAWTSGKYEEHEACWNGSTGQVPQHESALTQRLHLHFRKPWHFLQDKVTPLCTSVQKNHKELCQDFSKENHLGTAGRISRWFESLWRDPNLAAELFSQPCSSEHILNPFFCFPNPSRLSFFPLFEGKRGKQQRQLLPLLPSACQPAEVTEQDLSLCWTHPDAQETEDCKNPQWANRKCSCESFKRLKESQTWVKERESFRLSTVHSSTTREDQLCSSYYQQMLS